MVALSSFRRHRLIAIVQLGEAEGCLYSLMCQFKVHTFGQFAAEYIECPPIRFASSKEQELLSYLVLRRGRRHARELLASVLWGDATADRSKKYLRTELWRLRTDTMPPDGSPPVVKATREWIRINPQADVWSDASVLESTHDLVRGKPAERLTPQEAALLEEAIQLYEGRLLEGWYQDWCQAERERLHQVYLDIADKLMAYSEIHGHHDAGIALGLRVMTEEPMRERTHRRLMRLYYHAGDRASALEQYDRCESILCESLGVEPSAETRALYQQLRVDSLERPAVGEPRRDRVDLVLILRRVDVLRRLLDGLRREIEHEIEHPRRSPGQGFRQVE